MTTATPKPRAGEHVLREPMTTGRGMSAAESKAYQRGIAAGKREREDAFTTIIKELEAERDALRAREAELVAALASIDQLMMAMPLTSKNEHQVHGIAHRALAKVRPA